MKKTKPVWVVWKVGHPRERGSQAIDETKKKKKKERMNNNKNYGKSVLFREREI